jgi:DNA-directed RNA polymerases I and III subunit RPAC2
MNEIINRKILVENDGTEDEYCKTFIIQNEDHTLANPLRYFIMKNPNVLFCGYSIPHPSENRVNFRIQSKNQTAVQVLEKGLEDLYSMCQKVHDKFEQAIVDYKNK